MNNYTKHQRRILKLMKEHPGKIIITAEQGLGKNQKPKIIY